ncbi:helicase RepA family protein [Aliivibrio salmonicida]|nr:helicase RepA family protein [Aliivibrio salmonicida]
MSQQIQNLELNTKNHLERFGTLLFSIGSKGYDCVANWLVHDLIPSSSFGIIYGASGSLKSFLAIDLCCSITRGNHWNYHAVKKGAVVYVAAEGQMGVAKRIKACEIANSIKTEHLYVLGHSLTMSEESNQEALITAIQEIEQTRNVKVQLVVLDTLARCYSGDENTSRDMSAFVHGCDIVRAVTDTTILCIHHSGRDEAKGARGSSALKAACDFEFHVKRTGKSKLLTFTNTKQKDGEEAPNMEVEFDSIELGINDVNGKALTSLALIKSVVQQHNLIVSDNPVIKALQENSISKIKRTHLKEMLFPNTTMNVAQRKSLSRWLKNLESDGKILIEKISIQKSSPDDMIVNLLH